MAARPSEKAHCEDSLHPIVDTFRLIAETRRQANFISDTARKAIKSFYRNPAELAAFIERHETPVYVLPKGFIYSLFLWLLGYEPGFVAPSDGKRYQVLTQFLTSAHLKGMQGEKRGCRFDYGVFVVTRPLFTVGFISHQLHHWLACRSGMTGYSDRAQHLYRKFWNENNGTIGREVYKMNLDDMKALKSAINRDLEALLFLREISNEVLIPAKQAQRLQHGRTIA